MGKINKKDFLDGVHNIIKESLETPQVPNVIDTKFNMKKAMNMLLESVHSGDADLMNYLSQYQGAFKGNGSDILVYESFCKGLAKYSKSNEGVKAELRSLLENVNANRQEYVLIRLYESIQDNTCKALITEALNKYLYDKSDESRLQLNEKLITAFRYNDEAIKGIYNVINENLYLDKNDSRSTMQNVVKQPNYITLFESVNSALEEAEQKQEEKGVVLNEEKMNNLYEKIDEYVNNKINEALKDKDENKFTLESAYNSNGLNLRESMIKIGNKTKNPIVHAILERYENSLNSGVPEERLCEAFISDLKPYSIDPTETELSALEKRLDSAKVQVDLVKILDLMKESTSYFIVPHIETDVIRYVKDKTPINRVQLENACGPFASDPYVRQILTLVMLDNDRKTVYAGLEESVLSIKDQAKIISENASVKSVYSPIQYIKEGVSVFNVNNKFYIKKGSLISKLDNQYLNNLSESFIQLCKLVNDDKVEMHDDFIDLYSLDESLHGKIYDGYAEINGNKESKNSLRNLNEMYMKYNNYDTNFFVMASCLLENFNNIAKVDFVKHIELNEDKDINLDLFLLNEKNMYILTNDEHLHNHTFYRNVNPIQCKNIMNEHMGINVSYLFEDLLPNQDKIMLMLNETKDSYEKDIEKLKQSIEDLKDAKEDVESEDDIKKLDDAIKATEEKLADTEKEYDEWKETANDELDSDAAKDSEGSAADKYADDDVASDESNNDLPDEDYNKDELTSSLDNINNSETPITTVEGIDNDDYSDNAIDDVELPSDASNEDNGLGYDPNDFDFDDYEEGDEEITTDDDTSDVNSVDDVDVELPSDIENDAAGEPETDAPSDDIENPDEFNPDDATDIFETPEKETEPEDFDIENVEGEITDENIYDSDFRFKITNVMFDENVKTGEKYKSGNVSYIVPMIDGDGKKYVQSQDISFTINGNNDVYLANNEGMTEELYQSIVDSIKNAPDFSTFASEGTDMNSGSIKAVEGETSDTDVNPDDLFNDASNEERTDFDLDFSQDDNGDENLNVTTDDGESYDFDLGKDFEDEDVDIDFSESNNTPKVKKSPKDPVPVYKDEDGTEFELPAASEDGTEIKESKNELLGIKSNFKKGSSATMKMKKNQKSRLLESETNDELLDDMSDYDDEDSLNVKYEYSSLEYLDNIKESLDSLADQANSSDDEDVDEDDIIDVSEVKSMAFDANPEDEDDETEDTVNYITISQIGYKKENADEDDDTVEESLDEWPIIDEDTSDFKSYTIYMINDDTNLYYVATDDFITATEDADDPIGILEENDLIDVTNNEDKNELLENIISSISGVDVKLEPIDTENTDYDSDEDTLNEKLKINKTELKRRKESLGNSENDGPQDVFNDSKFVDEIFNGDADEKEHKAKMNAESEEETTTANENFKPKLPSFHASKKLDESRGDKIKREPEPHDTALFRGELVTVLSKNADGTYTVLDKDGLTIDVTKNQLTLYNVDALDNTIDAFGFGKGKDNWRVPLEKDPMNTKYANFNKSVEYLPSNIIMDNSGARLNTNECYASMKDLIAKKHRVKVINESGEASYYPSETIEVLPIDQEDWPYAVIVSGEEDEPNRKIRINPKSYVEAQTDDDIVECLVADKLTELPKGVIRIIS